MIFTKTVGERLIKVFHKRIAWSKQNLFVCYRISKFQFQHKRLSSPKQNATPKKARRRRRVSKNKKAKGSQGGGAH